MNAPSYTELVVPDPWEEFYDKQNQNAVHESSGGGGDGGGNNDSTDGHNQNVVVHSTDNCDHSEIVADQSTAPEQHTQWHNSNNNNNNSCSFDNAPSGAQESHSQYQHDGCTDNHHENPAPQQEQEQHHHSHYHHHHHHHDHHEHHESPSSHEPNPHTIEPSIIEHTNQSQYEYENHECIVPIEHETSSVHETSESNDDQVRKTFVANTTINAKRRDRNDERSH